MRRRYIRSLIGSALVTALTLCVLAKEQKPTRRQNQKPYSSNYEKYAGVEVAAKQILFKLDPCPADDSQSLIPKLTKLAMDLTGDNTLVLSRVGNGCVFLARSTKLTVRELLLAFRSTLKVNGLLSSFGFESKMAYAEPNYIIRPKRFPEDGPTVRPTVQKKKEPDWVKHHPGGPRIPVHPNDDYFQRGQLWGLKNTLRRGIDIDALPAWGISTGLPTIVVGVIDTGVDFDHPDLRPNVWTVTEEFDVQLAGQTIRCRVGSHGYDALAPSLEEACGPSPGNDGDGHGTHVAGIIGAVGDNRDGVVGVNWHTEIMGLRFMGPFGGSISDAINAIDFAIQVQTSSKGNVRVLNASWGYGPGANSTVESLALKDAIARANDRDILFVASAGEDNGNDNDVIPHYPSEFVDLPNVLSVTAINQLGGLAVMHHSAANHGSSKVHLAAPGKTIYSTYPTSLGYSYYQMSGTSMATPFVAGAAALILSVPACSALHAAELRRVINKNTTATSSASQTATQGRLDVFRSITLCGNTH